MLLAFYWVIIGLLLGDYWAVIGLLGYPQAYHSITNSIASATFGGSEMPPLPLHSCPSRRHPFLFSGMPCRFLPSSITPASYAVFSLRSPIRHSCRCWILCIVPTDSRRFLLFPDIRCRSGDPDRRNLLADATVVAPAPYASAKFGGFCRQEATKKQTREQSRVCFLVTDGR